VAGDCARGSFEESRLPVPPEVGFVAVYSRRDGIVDWRACIDPIATAVEVRSTHLGMVFDPSSITTIVRAVADVGDVLH
jgi:triacylglycerol lipase